MYEPAGLGAPAAGGTAPGGNIGGTPATAANGGAAIKVGPPAAIVPEIKSRDPWILSGATPAAASG